MNSTVVVYYSKDNNTRTGAKILSDRIGAKIVELTEIRKANFVQALSKKSSKLAGDPWGEIKDAKIIYLMSPIWASNTLFVGFSIIVLWIMLFATSQVPELETEPFSLALHVLSELILAVSLLFTGIGYMKNTRWVPYMFMLSMGLLIYSVMNVAGYYGESGNFAMVIIFAVLLVIAVLLTVLTLKEILSKNND